MKEKTIIAPIYRWGDFYQKRSHGELSGRAITQTQSASLLLSTEHHTVSTKPLRSCEHDGRGPQETEGLTWPGNMYTKEMTFALVLREEELARMTRAKRPPHKHGKA